MARLRDLLTAGRRAVRAGRLEAYRYLRDRRAVAGDGIDAPGGGDVEAAAAPGSRGAVAPVVVYFPDAPDNLYQLGSWLPALEEVHERHPVAVVCRSSATVEALETTTALPVLLVRGYHDLGACYDAVRAKVCLYVNNNPLNFLSLTFADQLHVHLNHGESDKISMASNQAKAYDRVLVAGQAAIDRYRRHLLDFDAARLVPVGRPQLDRLPRARLGDADGPDGNRTVLYAPTWEGGRAEMDYGSVATMGEAVVAALDRAGWRVLYRPHPKVGLVDPATARAHERIVGHVTAPAGRAAGHRLSPPDEPLGEAFAAAEVLVADVSSVLLDFLVTGRPVVVTRPSGGAGRFVGDEPESVRVAHAVTPDDVDDLGALLDGLREHDPLRDARAAAVERIFGDTTPAAATRRFVAALDAIVAERDRLVAERAARGAEAAVAPEGT